MNSFAKMLAVAAFTLGSATIASASPITGSGAISGTDTFTANSITFNPATGFFYAGTGSMAAFNGSTANLTSFTTASAVGTTVFSATSGASTLSFLITGVTFQDYNPGVSLTYRGTGTFSETGYDATAGNFSLTTSTAVDGVGGTITSFTLNGLATPAVTPEPSSLLLLGTGLVGTATTFLRRRRLVA